MNKIIIIYKGYNPKNLKQIELALNENTIPFHKAQSDWPKSYEEPLRSKVTDFFLKNYLTSPWYFRYSAAKEEQCLRKYGYRPRPFEIQIRQKDEELARTVLNSLPLDEKILSLTIDEQNSYTAYLTKILQTFLIAIFPFLLLALIKYFSI